MFTGLIQSVGRLSLRSGGLLVKGCAAFSPIKLGDSVAVDGVCLTVAKLSEDGFWADVSEETLARTCLGQKAQCGSEVNLEPALRLSDRLGGHLVTGHIDGLGEILSVQKLSNSWKVELKWIEKSYGKYICEKGSIAIDGVSLTVGGCTENGITFWIAVIPHTWQSTSLRYFKQGSLVNLEADLFAKYTERLLQKKEISPFSENHSSRDISQSWLAQNGWL